MITETLFSLSALSGVALTWQYIRHQNQMLGRARIDFAELEDTLERVQTTAEVHAVEHAALRLQQPRWVLDTDPYHKSRSHRYLKVADALYTEHDVLGAKLRSEELKGDSARFVPTHD